MRASDSVGPPGAQFRRRKRLANTLLAAALLGCAVLLLCPPAWIRFYPACPVHLYLGLLCPGCGATRALAALLRGRVMEAMRLNALFVLLLPIALAGAIESYRRALRAERFRWPQPPAAALYATLAVAAIFTLARNLL
jgi:hypothetical protein